jgi:hypothetical protein
MIRGVARRYGLVLIVILVSLAFQLAAPDEDWSRLVAVLLQGVALIVALYAARVRPGLRRAATIAAALAVLGAAGAVIGTDAVGAGVLRLTNLGLVLVAPAAIAYGLARDVREEGGVSVTTMFGVLCIYLLAGMAFAAAFGAIDDLSSDPFFGAGQPGDTEDFLYFSFATLTTVGYGDLTAATDLGRSLAIMEALIGQIYLVTVVALIVGNLARRGGPVTGALLVAILCGAVAVGCGEKEEPEAVGAARAIAEGDDICAAASEEVAALRADAAPRTPAEAAKLTEGVIDAYEAEIADLEALSVPAELADELDRYVTAREQALAPLRDGLAAARSGDAQAYAEAQAEAAAGQVKRTRLAREVGFSECSVPIGSASAG